MRKRQSRRRLKPRHHRVVSTAGSALSAEIWSYDSAREREFYVETRTLDDRTALVVFKVRRPSHSTENTT